MKPVEIYTTPICGYCTAAKRLLNKKGVEYTEYNVMLKPALRAEMTQRSNGGRTVPQIFIDGKPIGGCDELFGLEGGDVLDKLLA
ncbi:MAG: glutaredoxin 3 [Rhodobacteraceae bacterium]|nr:glutaredoxin 3 [Paracoccaceae bacterium]